ncbi:MAG: 1-acyl-sn-glycerol-3-phosphate acyltransferase [Chlorobi bacterium]|nr:1-acyl-sn-glycerol-3-phosphate acyltransferase [Chlorobiota bacterium]
MMNRIIGLGWVIWFYLIAGIVGLGVLPFVPFCVISRSCMQFLRRLWTSLTFLLTGVTVNAIYDPEFLEYFHKGNPVIFCPNHASHLDIPVMLEATGGDISFIAKYELAMNPLLFPYLKRLDLLVKRNSVVHSAMVWRKATQLLNNGISLVVFPEGKIVYNDKTPCMGRLKNGAFKLAVETGHPIVPVAILDNWHIMGDDGRFGGHPGTARVLFLKPIYPEGNANELKQKYESAMSRYLCNLKK